MPILAVNAGSSSLKFSLHPHAPAVEADGPLTEPSTALLADAILTGHVQGLEPGGAPRFKWRRGADSGDARLDPGEHPFDAALLALRDVLEQQFAQVAIEAVAHRVVHGGLRYRDSVLVTEQVLADLAELAPLAPLHQMHSLAAIRLFAALFPDVPQVACFDTAFHASLPDIEATYPLPRALTARGVRRYGFHGLSYQYVLGRLRLLSPRANDGLVMAHLGNGASLCATLDGTSRATTMGLTPLDGLMMGTRCGAIDPGIVLYLLRQGWDADRIETMLYSESGILGVSGRSADLRALDGENDAAARFAVEVFCQRAARETAALAVSVGGLDVLAFTGGIGEHRSEVREDICRQLSFLGVALDPERNRAASGAPASAIHADTSAVEVWVVPTDEGRVAASEAARLLDQAQRPEPKAPAPDSVL